MEKRGEPRRAGKFLFLGSSLANFWSWQRFKTLKPNQHIERKEKNCSLVNTKSNAVDKIVLEGSLLLYLEINTTRLTTLD